MTNSVSIVVRLAQIVAVVCVTNVSARAQEGDHDTVGLRLPRAVAEFLAEPADIVLALSGKAWATLYLSRATLADLVDAGEIEVRTGTVEQAANVVELFDRYDPEKAVLIRPHLHD